MRLAVRQVATARVLDAEVGACDLSRWFEAVGTGPGLLVLDGLIAVEASVGDRTAAELIGPGDLLQPAYPLAENLLKRSDAWRALGPTRFALLDAEFADESGDSSSPEYVPAPPDPSSFTGTVVTSVISPVRAGSAGPLELSRRPTRVPPTASSAQAPASTRRPRRPIAQLRRGLSGPISRMSPPSGPDPSMLPL